MLNAVGDYLFGNLVEGHSLCFLVREIQQFLQVPGYGLAFAVRVGREIDDGGLLAGGLQFVNQFLLFLDRDVLRRKAVFDIHAKLTLGQVTQMPHRGGHAIIAAQIFFNGFCLGRRFHNHQFLCLGHSHVSSLCMNFCTRKAFSGLVPDKSPNLEDRKL